MSALSVASDAKEEEKLGELGGWLTVRAAVMRTAACVETERTKRPHNHAQLVTPTLSFPLFCFFTSLSYINTTTQNVTSRLTLRH